MSVASTRMFEIASFVSTKRSHVLMTLNHSSSACSMTASLDTLPLEVLSSIVQLLDDYRIYLRLHPQAPHPTLINALSRVNKRLRAAVLPLVVSEVHIKDIDRMHQLHVWAVSEWSFSINGEFIHPGKLVGYDFQVHSTRAATMKLIEDSWKVAPSVWLRHDAYAFDDRSCSRRPATYSNSRYSGYRTASENHRTHIFPVNTTASMVCTDKARLLQAVLNFMSNLTTLVVDVEEVYHRLLHACLKLKSLRSLTFAWETEYSDDNPSLSRGTYEAMEAGTFPRLEELRIRLLNPWNHALGRLIEYQSSSLVTLALQGPGPAREDDILRLGRELSSLSFPKLKRLTIHSGICPLPYVVDLISRHQRVLQEVNVGVAGACYRQYVRWPALRELMCLRWDPGLEGAPFYRTRIEEEEPKGDFAVGSFAFLRKRLQQQQVHRLGSNGLAEGDIIEMALQVGMPHHEVDEAEPKPGADELRSILKVFPNLERLLIFSDEFDIEQEPLVCEPFFSSCFEVTSLRLKVCTGLQERLLATMSCLPKLLHLTIAVSTRGPGWYPPSDVQEVSAQFFELAAADMDDDEPNDNRYPDAGYEADYFTCAQEAYRERGLESVVHLWETDHYQAVARMVRLLASRNPCLECFEWYPAVGSELGKRNPVWVWKVTRRAWAGGRVDPSVSGRLVWSESSAHVKILGVVVGKEREWLHQLEKDRQDSGRHE